MFIQMWAFMESKIHFNMILVYDGNISQYTVMEMVWLQRKDLPSSAQTVMFLYTGTL